MAERDEEYRLAKRRVVTEALQLFATIWPVKFSAANVKAHLDAWVDACDSAAIAFVVPAARKLVAEARSGTFPPKPADLCDRARYLERQAQPTQPARSEAMAHVAASGKDVTRIDVLGRRAHEALGSWERVAEVWAMLWRTATCDDERAMVRAGTVPDDLFDEAVGLVAAQRAA